VIGMAAKTKRLKHASVMMALAAIVAVGMIEGVKNYGVNASLWDFLKELAGF